MNTETLYTMLKSALFAGRSSVLNAARQDCFNLYKMASSRQDQEMLIKLDALFRPELQRFIDSKNIDAFYDMESKKAYMELSRNNAREAALAATKTYAEQYLKYLDDNATYLGNQLECEFGGDRCFGIAANMEFILICTYEENGENPELVVYKNR